MTVKKRLNWREKKSREGGIEEDGEERCLPVPSTSF